MKNSKLLLANGEIFEGIAFGYIGESIGEVCFNTGMTGYQEILTDPSYSNQLVTMTYPHIGNYGINDIDIESSKPQVAGFIVSRACKYPSNYRSTNSLDNYLKENKIVGIECIDTRKLTRILRNEGAMNGIISSIDNNIVSLDKKLKKAPNMEGLDLSKKVTCNASYWWNNKKNRKFNIAVIDYGVKENILRLLDKLKYNIKVFPCTASADEILDCNPAGIFLSNGPGDPAAVNYGIIEVKKLMGVRPIFGICLGHQLLALALGAKTYKLKFGHRGCNHPVKNLKTGKVEITSQNHGFSVDPKTLPNNVEITHLSLNDDTLEGISCKDFPAFSVQYHPESSPGPHDSRYLFNNFLISMKAFSKCQKEQI